MNEQTTNKTEKKVNAKPDSIKPAACNTKPAPIKPGDNQEKVIAQLRQEINNLAKTVKDMQKKQDTQSVMVMIPSKMLQEINVYLSEVSRSIGHTVSLSDLTCDALDLYLDAEKENEKLEEERRLAG